MASTAAPSLLLSLCITICGDAITMTVTMTVMRMRLMSWALSQYHQSLFPQALQSPRRTQARGRYLHPSHAIITAPLSLTRKIPPPAARRPIAATSTICHPEPSSSAHDPLRRLPFTARKSHHDATRYGA
ncbi:hypothetical protein EDB89DRAFT_1914691 [Lactarius sanguifluus]|nr:hypothetical protein EDB89DRAFT_1914691 [Lactarius sanguifluus]